MPLFLLSIGASKTTLSLIEGIAESTASLLKAVSGFWSDKLGRNKPFMIFGYGLTALITPIYAFITTPFQVLIFRFVERVGKGVRTAPRDSLISGSISSANAGKNFGFHKAMDNSGAIAGPLLASFMLIIFPLNYQFIFILATVPALMGVVAIILYVRENKAAPPTSTSLSSFKKLPRKYYLFLSIVFVFSLGNSTDALLLVKTSETGIKPSYIPFIYMIFNSVSVIFAIPAGKLSDKAGRETMIIAGYFIYSMVYLIFGKFQHIGILLMAFILYGLYSALTDSAQKALISDLTGKNLKGTGFGIYHAILGITLLPASLIAGILYDKINSAAPFYFGAIMAFLAALLLIVFKRSFRNQEEKSLCKI